MFIYLPTAQLYSIYSGTQYTFYLIYVLQLSEGSRMRLHPLPKKKNVVLPTTIRGEYVLYYLHSKKVGTYSTSMSYSMCIYSIAASVCL